MAEWVEIHLRHEMAQFILAVMTGAFGVGRLVRGIFCIATCAAMGCGGSSTAGSTGGSAPPVTPTVTVTPGASSVTTAQTLTVTVSVAGSSASTPAGTVVVSSGSYASAQLTLSGGSAMVTVPAGLLVVGSDTLTASYTPETASAGTYSSATGNAVVPVGAGAAVLPPTMGASLVLPTASAPFQALPAANGTVFVGEANGLEVFAPVAGVLT